MNKNIKIIAGVLLVGGTLVFLAISGFDEGKSYYKFVDEVQAMGEDAYTKKLKVHGNVVDGSIRKNGSQLEFVITRNGATMPVKYIGKDPVPDTFKDGCEAVIDGRYKKDGTFEGTQIQAKCASKYETDYNDLKKGS
ncbi:MAG TPA: cytochrome c maturation protein CcmE [bacterium]|nr:cytochrome c maturation protein CcmE [bacterium]HMW36034.1 cytochrome c maturation protein CcmE [bacterium]HMY37215.1 cytochrome c maturation protein CcmE [bacterium]HMZ05009.1 cytochrome c maturation protein CcmE [bacterium]HNB10985.1 cytochrome c maturation protein CcmE [bacterium]